MPSPDQPLSFASATHLRQTLSVGDLVFIRIPLRPFTLVADATDSWTNHVGIVVDTSGPEPVIGESAFPLSRFTKLSRFVARSEQRRVAVCRLNEPLDAMQRLRVYIAARRRTGILYDTGFNLQSRRQFCSRYVREVMAEAANVTLGEIQSFSTLLARNPRINLNFWSLWYFGRIPWTRQTVSPASLLHSPCLTPLFDGHVGVACAARGDTPPH
jgi:hypothetical protein